MMKHSSKFVVHLPIAFADEVKAAAQRCGLPPAQYIAQAVEGFFAQQRLTRWEGGKEVKTRPRMHAPSSP
jgi:hypothetical protein